MNMPDCQKRRRILSSFRQSGRPAIGNRGFTLPEAIISLTLFTVIALTISALFVSGSRQEREESIRSRLATSLTTVNDQMSRDIKAAFQVETSFGGFTTGAETLILSVPAVNSSGNILYSGGAFVTDRIIYRKNGPTILKSVTPAAASSRQAVTDQEIADSVTALTYAYDQPAPNTKQITWVITAVDDFQNRTVEVSLQQVAKLRNRT